MRQEKKTAERERENRVERREGRNKRGGDRRDKRRSEGRGNNPYTITHIDTNQ
jgi:hypothetical protein